MESRKPPASLLEASSLLDRPLSPSRFSYLGRRKSSPSPSLLSADGITASVSCVTRETSQDDCARHRFIVWAAVKRNSCGRMSPSEKLECPLLRCRKRFVDHETMLVHLAECDHLASGEYWCYEHMRPERFDDLKCRRCLGHPSKRRKMLSMAKNFFQSLGHKPRRGSAFDFACDGDGFSPRPSCDSFGGVGGGDAGPSHFGVELSGMEICEIDSREIQPPRIDQGINPQSLLIPELDSTIGVDGMDGHGDPLKMPPLYLATQLVEQTQMSCRPPPRPTSTAPRSKGLSPSSSVRSTNSTNSTDSNVSATSNVSSLVSPASVWSGAWSLASSVPTDLTNAEEIFDVPAFFPEQSSHAQMEDCPANFAQDAVPELPADIPPQAELGLDLSSDPIFFAFEESIPSTVSYDAHLVLTDDVPAPPEIIKTASQDPDTCCSETKTMVASAWDAVQQHVMSSTLKVRHLRGNPLAYRLGSQSAKSTALAGLRVLRALLSGSSPTSSEDILSFVHLIYSLSLTLHEDEATTRSSQLFLQALAYRNCLSYEERHAYIQLVREIWQPVGLPQAVIEEYMAQLPRLPANGKGKQPDYDGRTLDLRIDDAMTTAARHFLDELEATVICCDMPTGVDVLSSNLYSTHLQDFSLSETGSPLTLTLSLIISRLCQRFSETPKLVGRLNGVSQSVTSGRVLSIRRAELELLRAGKNSMTRAAYLDQFAPTVKQLCDPMYQQLACETSKRDAYHLAGVALMEDLVNHFESPGPKSPSPGYKLETPRTEALPSPIEPDTMASFMNTEEFAIMPGQDAKLNETMADFMNPSINPSMDPALNPLGSHHVVVAPTPDPSPLLAKVSADACCEICGYRPKGDPQWFKGSMAKHKKLQHSVTPPQVYKCPYPGCTSAYKSRPDNLRQHQIEKNHFVGEDTATRRPSKRKKVAEE